MFLISYCIKSKAKVKSKCEESGEEKTKTSKKE